MKQPGAIGYVVINFDGKKHNQPAKRLIIINGLCVGIPVKAFPEDKIPTVQYAALVADLVMKTKKTLKELNQGDNDFVYLRMRTKQDTEMIVTDYIVPSSGNEYILVCLQQCKFNKEEEEVAEVWELWWCYPLSVVLYFS